MTSPRKTLHCCACGKSQMDVKILVAVDPRSKILICNECVDMCHEIAHESDGMVNVSIAELEELRRKANDIGLLAKDRYWIECIRNAVERADAAYKAGFSLVALEANK